MLNKFSIITRKITGFIISYIIIGEFNDQCTLDKNAIIAREKLTQYRLIPLPKDDKSKYLEKGGYNLDNWQQLEKGLRKQILTLNAYPTQKTNYRQKHEMVSILNCQNGK